MTDDQKTTATRSISFANLLSVAFIVLKLCHVIEWAWIWVLAPIWIPWALVLAILAIAGLMILIGSLLNLR